MPLTSDIYDLVQKFRQTLLEQLQFAAQIDQHHYQIVAISDIQFKFPAVKNKVDYFLTLQIHPEALIEPQTMRFFLTRLIGSINMELLEYKPADARWRKYGSNEVDDYNVVVRGGFTPNNTDPDVLTTTPHLILSWSEIEDMTESAIYEADDAPETLKINEKNYSLVSVDSVEQTARYMEVPF